MYKPLKIMYLMHDGAYPRTMNPIIDQMNTAVAIAARDLDRYGYRIPFRILIAREMRRYYLAFEEVARKARKVEEQTGFSGLIDFGD